MRKSILGLLIMFVSFTAWSSDYDKAQKAFDNGEYASAARLFLPLARDGNLEAQYKLGSMSHAGSGVKQDESVAVKWYARAAEGGLLIAQIEMGFRHQFGWEVALDHEAALKWYTLAAEQGPETRDSYRALAQHNLAYMYAHGQGTPKDEEVAVRWYTISAQLGNASAQYQLGSMYAKGQGVTQDEAVALSWLTLSAEQGYKPAQITLGLRYEFGQGVWQDSDTAKKWYTLAAEPGDAQVPLGGLNGYLNGQDILPEEFFAHLWFKMAGSMPDKDATVLEYSEEWNSAFESGMAAFREGYWTRAMRQWRSLAQQGHLRSQYALATMYQFGLGVEQDHESAFKWYALAADQDYSYAQYHLGLMYETGQVVEQADETALQWYTAAAEQGHARAQYNLGRMYEYTFADQLQNEELAWQWYVRAAKQGDKPANIIVGSRVEFGRGYRADPDGARDWYDDVIQEGSAYAQQYLALMYAQGWGVLQDDEASVKWVRLAANQWYADALFTYGLWHEQGRGIPPEPGLAFQTYKKAAEEGLKPARLRQAEIAYDNNSMEVAWDAFLSLAQQGYVRAQYGAWRTYRSRSFNYGASQEDAEAALKWLNLAVERGYAPAQRALAGVYQSGLSIRGDRDEPTVLVAENLDTAAKWYGVAVDQGDVKAMRLLGDMYEFDEPDSKENHRLALKWYREAAEHGDIRSQNELGVRYLMGYRVTQDYEKAKKWLTLAANTTGVTKNDDWGYAVDAQFTLGRMYEQGEGVEQDYQAAWEWFRLAAEPWEMSRGTVKGFWRAQYRLGKMYEEGRGVVQDDQAAIRWYTRASQYPYPAATYALGLLYAKPGYLQNKIWAYVWFDLTVQYDRDESPRFPDAPEARDLIAAEMTPGDRLRADNLVAEYKDQLFKDR